MDAYNRVEEEGASVLQADWAAAQSPDLPEDMDEVQAEPSSPLWNSRPDTSKWLAAHHVGAADPTVRYLIQGWLAERGTSVWFGAGSTGKTQLMLWMAAMLASRQEDRPEQTWLGGRIHGSGHILILTAEDTREQIVGRLRDVVEHCMGQDAAARMRTCARIHIMPFLSMREKEFDHPNPSLFQQNRDREWETTEVMKEVRRYISEWNRARSAAEDRIIGVVMDSATSMSGFDSLDAQATTNFFFYLGRLCERLSLFWAVIGHTPKTTTLSRSNYRATAPSRLRGVAMWTTAPRLTVEVRLVQDWRERNRSVPEAPDIRDWLGNRVKRENLLVVYVAKANLKQACREERYLARQRHGAFVDVTKKPAEVLSSGLLDGWDDEIDGDESAAVVDEGAPASGPSLDPGARSSRSASGSARSGRPRLDAVFFAAGTDLVAEVIRETYPDDGRGRPVSANRLFALIRRRAAEEPRSKLVKTANRSDRVGAINWHLEQLAQAGRLARYGRYFHLPSRGAAIPIAATEGG